VVGTITHPTCGLSTGSVVLSGLPADNWKLTRNPGGVTINSSGSSYSVSGLLAGTYTFTVTNAATCTSVASDEVIINAQPATPTKPVVGTIVHPTCTVATGSVVLDGLPLGTWTITRYPGTITSTGEGMSTTITGLAAGSATNYTVTNSSGCTSLPSSNVVINAQPVTPSAPVVGTITHPTFAVPSGSVILSGLPAGSWTLTRNPDGVITTGTTTSKTITGIAPGTYTFTVTNAVLCTSVPSANVVINAIPGVPVVVITDPATICSNQTADITLPAITKGSDANLTFTYWADAAATIPYTTPTAATPGTWYIKGTTTAGYSTIKPVTITANQMPVADAGPDRVLEYLFSTEMSAAPLNVNETGTWSIFEGSGVFSHPNASETTVSGLDLGENILLWRVSNGVCPYSDDYVTITVNDLLIPTLITPNGDSYNEYFVLRGIETLGKTELTIFDRRGAQVYKNMTYDNSWNGLGYNGNELPEDTYFYVMKSQNGKSLSGYIVIRR
jgi:gliding motility-associated-like protein